MWLKYLFIPILAVVLMILITLEHRRTEAIRSEERRIQDLKNDKFRLESVYEAHCENPECREHLYNDLSYFTEISMCDAHLVSDKITKEDFDGLIQCPLCGYGIDFIPRQRLDSERNLVIESRLKAKTDAV